MKAVMILILIALTACAAFGQSYKSYDNSRFGYTISYPADLLKPQGEADNGDGQIFLGERAEMRVYGSNLLLNETLAEEYKAIVREKGSTVTYKLLKAKFFVVSGIDHGRIYYQKTFRNADGAFITFMIEYDESMRSTYDKAVTKMVASFK